jgi:hypothetical protein
MILVQQPAKQRYSSGQETSRQSRRVVTYPPPSTGTNYNLIDKVEHGPSERIIWHRIHAPEGSFVYDYELSRKNKQAIERMCLDCRRTKVHGGKRLCNACANSRKRASNRRSQSKRRSNVRKTGFSLLQDESLTDAVQPTSYVGTVKRDRGELTHK